jgi:hypothetical protein
VDERRLEVKVLVRYVAFFMALVYTPIVGLGALFICGLQQRDHRAWLGTPFFALGYIIIAAYALVGYAQAHADERKLRPPTESGWD